MRSVSCLLILLFLIGCAPGEYRGIKNVYTAAGKTLVCFGDSLTAGQGAPPGFDYPSILARELPLPVVNAGISGDTAAKALLRVEKDVLSKDPKIVIVELGPNDFLRTGGRWEGVEGAFQNLETIIEKIQNYGAVVVVAGVSINYEIGQRYQKLAERKGALLVPNIMGGVLGNTDLMSDQFHPNAKGYKIMADRFLEVLAPLLEEMR